MTKTNDRKPQPRRVKTDKQRRALLKKLGRFTAVTAPTVTLLLVAKVKPGAAFPVSCAPSSRAFKTRVGPVDGATVLVALEALPIRI
jgi:hypothetical protein